MENNIWTEKINTAYDELVNLLDFDSVKKYEPMKNHTTFRVGGVADLFIRPKNTDDIKITVEYCKSNQIPFYVIGNGSNLIVTDKGVRGCIIQIYDNFSEVLVDNEIIKCQSGALLSKVAFMAMENSLGGMEFASGIPGSVGGGISMNAGAYGGEMKDIIFSVDILDVSGNIITLENSQMEFGYRKSIVSNTDNIILSCVIKLSSENKEDIKNKMSELATSRREKQPLEFPSAGSTFKRPEGYFAGKLIADAGLKGFSIGGAEVSPKHAGFIVNKGGATADDILKLIQHCKDVVSSEFGVNLETEVKVIGEL